MIIICDIKFNSITMSQYRDSVDENHGYITTENENHRGIDPKKYLDTLAKISMIGTDTAEEREKNDKRFIKWLIDTGRITPNEIEELKKTSHDPLAKHLIMNEEVFHEYIKFVSLDKE